MAELPIMPIKTDALIADTTHMTTQEFGAYMLLLVKMWREGGKLVDDQRELAKAAGVSPKVWCVLAPRVMRPMTVAAGFVSQKRLTATWLDVQDKRRKAAKAADAKWKKFHADAHADASAEPMRNASNQIEEERITPTFSEAPRASPVDSPRQVGEPQSAPATALPMGARALRPGQAAKRAADGSWGASPALLASMAARGWIKSPGQPEASE